MNVMTQAHKATKAIVARKLVNGIKAVYAAVFKVQLKQAHKEYKAMTKPMNPVEAKLREGLATFEAMDTSGCTWRGCWVPRKSQLTPKLDALLPQPTFLATCTLMTLAILMVG